MNIRSEFWDGWRKTRYYWGRVRVPKKVAWFLARHIKADS